LKHKIIPQTTLTHHTNNYLPSPPPNPKCKAIMSHNPSPNQSSNTTRQLTTRPSTCAIKEIECRKLVSKNAKSKEAIYDGIVWCKTQETPSTSRMVIAMEHNERFCPICKAVATFEPDFAMWIPQPAKRFWQHRGRGVCYCGMPMWERMP
jgi:hypothetical protein